MEAFKVEKKTIKNLFSDMEGKKFIVPDYQRPYAWDKDKCEILWDDLKDFFDNEEEEYFLGTIVICKGENENETHVIDGQQRITSLFLLLRAFYFHLDDMEKDKYVTGLMGQIAPCIWDTNKLSKEVEDYSKIHIESKVATDAEKESFHKVLQNGEVSENIKDLYSKNYKFFLNKSKGYAQKEPMLWKNFVVTILDSCVILPIECKNLDSALTFLAH